jgi:pimeloyl-ACP methyl ester carboxylesterase
MADAHIYTPVKTRRSSKLSIRGIDYTVHEWGQADAPLIVFLHGFLDCGPTFQFVVDRLERDWHIVAPDLRGFGDSHGDVHAYWFPDYLADLDTLLTDLSPDLPARLVGHSMGANIAGLYAGAFPERVRAFVNLEGFGLPDSNPADAPARYRQWISGGRAEPRFQHYPNFAALADRVAERNPLMGRPEAEYVARCWARENGNAVELRADPLHRLKNPVLYRRAEAEACWHLVTADVLLVAGGASEFAGGANVISGAESLGLTFEGASLEVIDGAGHMLHFEAPATVAKSIEAFFAPHL